MYQRSNRLSNELRSISFERGYTKWAEGSILVKFGDTHLLCNATIEKKIPNWLKYSKNPHGWVTAEYGMLPRSGKQRNNREQKWPKGRTQEISRLIGRSLRMAVNLQELGLRQIIIDCDVLQADGGTRTAAITGGWIALQLALQPLIANGTIPPTVIKHQIAAISVGILQGDLFLDLDYPEDVSADVDFNVVMAPDNQLIEIQGTAEEKPFAASHLPAMVELAYQGIKTLHQKQWDCLNDR